jgi:hypothetical protein
VLGRKLSAEYSSETNIRQGLTKKVLFSDFISELNTYEKVKIQQIFVVNVFYAVCFCCCVYILTICNYLKPATAAHENLIFFSCAEYSLSAEYPAAIYCRIFIFGRDRKILLKKELLGETHTGR